MKRYKNIVLGTLLTSAVLLSGCHKDDCVPVNIGEYVPLKAVMSAPVSLFGENTYYTVNIVDPNNKGMTVNEDIKVKLSFKGTAELPDGTKQEVTGKDVFENFTESIPMEKGVRSATVSLASKKDLPYKSVEGILKAFSRGYSIANSEVAVKMMKHYPLQLSVLGQSNLEDVEVMSEKNFVIKFSIPAAAKEDMTVKIEAQASKDVTFANLPAALTIKKGFTSVKSGLITVKLNEAFKGNDAPIQLKLTAANPEQALVTDMLTLKVLNPDAELAPGTELRDERWVYRLPAQIFMSEKNTKDVKTWGTTADVHVMHEGDAHPNKTLAKKGWKFLNAMEFSPINALTARGKVNEYGNREPDFTAQQNVPNTQKYQAVVNAKYTNINDDGHLVLWSAYDPGIKATIWSGEIGVRNYGVGAIYMNKFDGANADKWRSNNVRILPGTRVEVRLRIRGQVYGFNPAVWFQGNKDRQDQWAYYGEVDLLEAPQWANGKKGGAWQTFHWNTVNESGEKYHPTSGEMGIDLTQFNIFWMEWRSNDEVAMGINGKELVKVNRSQYPGHWPYDSSYNPEGMHMLITFPAHNENWAGAGFPDFENLWDQYIKHIPYATSKTNPDTPRMEFDWIRYYKKDNYKYTGKGTPAQNIPMY